MLEGLLYLLLLLLLLILFLILLFIFLLCASRLSTRQSNIDRPLAARSSAGIRRKSELLLGVQKQNCKSLHFASVRMSGLEAKSRDLHPIRLCRRSLFPPQFTRMGSR